MRRRGGDRRGQAGGLIHDWNPPERRAGIRVELFDETLRDGLQAPSARHPAIHERVRLLRAMGAIGVAAADLGMPGAGPEEAAAVEALVREVGRGNTPVRAACAARTVPADVLAAIEIARRTGVPLEVYLFAGASRLRRRVEGWTLRAVRARTARAVDLAVKGGLGVCFVVEDATRTDPHALKALVRCAAEHGAGRICLADTAGHATPAGLERLFAFGAGIAGRLPLDWHGHNDRGLATALAVRAAQLGAARVHGCALGVGERAGNAALEQVAINLRLMGLIDNDLSGLPRYCGIAARVCGWAIPPNHPLVGRDAFRTATGTHAAAVLKAFAKGGPAMADLVFSGVPAGAFGLSQAIVIGPLTGAAAVRHWLGAHGLPRHRRAVEAVCAAARRRGRLLSAREIAAVAAGARR